MPTPGQQQKATDSNLCQIASNNYELKMLIMQQDIPFHPF